MMTKWSVYTTSSCVVHANVLEEFGYKTETRCHCVSVNRNCRGDRQTDEQTVRQTEGHRYRAKAVALLREDAQ